MNPEEQRTLIAQAAREMAETLMRLANALDVEEGSYSPASLQMPWTERTLRQSLIIADILDEGGNAGVPRERWYEIAAKYGYTGRGVAGFFREGSGGLLEIRKSGNVAVTKRGRERLAENRARVDKARAESLEQIGD